ncbi:hypothetical protein [Halothiobacillus sp.]|uniref:hypothetical protein n=1 Tax=Halothiobacillus sp. TaxID=1891311 RepID=UPI002AD2D142|nr:hypothetical protein [Halothiobacillus sp.]
MNQVDFSKRHSVTPASVSAWGKRGWIVFADDGSVDVTKSDELLKKYRRAKAKPKQAVLEIGEGETPSQAASRIIEQEGAPWSLDEAQRRKENYLALLRQLEYETKSGALISMPEAEAVLFEEFRTYRDAWLNWPTRVGPLIAADLGIEPDPVIEALQQHVHKHLADLGEPESDRVFDTGVSA